MRPLKVGLETTLMVALVVPDSETLLPAVRSEATFWKVGAPVPPDVRIWLAEPPTNAVVEGALWYGN